MKKILLFLSIIVMILSLCSCRTKKDLIQEEMAYENSRNITSINNDSIGFSQKTMATGGMGDGEAANNNTNYTNDKNINLERKLIKNIYIETETKSFDEAINLINTQVNKYAGYIENQGIYGNTTNNIKRNANFTLRIPKEKVNDFLSSISGILNVISRSENIEDITLNYSDTVLKKENLYIERDKLKELLKKATTIEDVLKIDERLTQVNTEIQKIETRLNHFDNKINYTTINIGITEVQDLSINDNVSIGEKIKQGLLKNFNECVSFIKKIIFNIITHLPSILIILLFLFIVISIVKHLHKKKNKKIIKDDENFFKKEDSIAKSNENETNIKKE